MNKPINLHYFYSCIHIFFSIFFTFLFFYFFIFWLGPAQPMWLGWTQQAQLGHWPKPVTLLTKACMRELFTLVVHSVKVIKITFAQCYITTKDEMKKRTYQVRGGRAEDDGWTILLSFFLFSICFFSVF